MFVSGRWGFVTKTGGLVINARSETVATNGLFKWSYQQRRALMPIDGFFEWKDIYSTGKDKQPYAIAMKSANHSRSPRSGRCGTTRKPKRESAPSACSPVSRTK